jgi:hypothetical protein
MKVECFAVTCKNRDKECYFREVILKDVSEKGCSYYEPIPKEGKKKKDVIEVSVPIKKKGRPKKK